MKRKIITLLIITLLLISGCSYTTKEKKSSKTNNDTNNIVENNEEKNDDTDEKEENSNTSTNEPENNTSDNTSSNTSTEPVTQIPETPTCTPKKFDNTYSYVYTTQEECMKGGNIAFLEITEDETSDIFSYECQKIIDECGTTYYGVIFYNAPNSIVYR